MKFKYTIFMQENDFEICRLQSEGHFVSIRSRCVTSYYGANSSSHKQVLE